MKAVILAGGTGTRLYPLTKILSKQLLPIGAKPMIYYPLSLAMLAGIKEILIIAQEKTLSLYKELFSNGSELGLSLSYKLQQEPIGLANGVYLAKEFADNDNFLFLLGDNVVHGHGLIQKIANALQKKDTTTIFSYFKHDPSSFGVIKFDQNGQMVDFVEKPNFFISNWISIGIYVFPSKIFQYYDEITKSRRGEFEIPDLVMKFKSHKNLVEVEKLGRGFVWFDAGTHDNYSKANNYINIQESSSQSKIACIEEISFRNKWISRSNLEKLIAKNKGEYIDYLKSIINEDN